MLKMVWSGVLSMALALTCVSSASANLITNGSFETGNLSGWTCVGADWCRALQGTPKSGLWSFHGFDTSRFATLSQTISTVVGTTYDVSFWARASALPGNQIGVSVSGFSNAVFSQGTNSYQQTTSSFVASGVTTTLEIFFANDDVGGLWYIDDVSVTARSTVPEPSTLSLLALSLLGGGLVGKRRTA